MITSTTFFFILTALHQSILSSFFIYHTLPSRCICFVFATKNDEPSTFDNVLDDEEIVGSALDPHPDPNDENYQGMIYIGRHNEDGTRMGFDKNNGETRFLHDGSSWGSV